MCEDAYIYRNAGCMIYAGNVDWGHSFFNAERAILPSIC